MNYRIAEIIASKDLGASGTEVIDIDIVDVMSRLVVLFKATNSADGWVAHPAANITKMELVDGSDVLFSVSGRQAQAVNFYNRKQTPWSILNGISGSQMQCTIEYDFGRYLWDRDMAFDPAKFINPQLKITYDEDAASGQCSANSCVVFGHLFDQRKATPRGFLMTKEHYSYTPAASAWEYVTMPRDYKCRNIFLRGYKADKMPYEVTNEIVINEDQKKRVPYEGKISNLLKFVAAENPVIREQFALNVAHDAFTYAYVTPSYETDAVGLSSTAAKAISFEENHYAEKIGLKAETAACQVRGLISGQIPHHMYPILFGDQQDEGDWFDVARLNSLRLDIKAGSGVSTDSTVEIVTQQYRPF